MSTEVRAQNTIALTSVKAIQDATERSAELLDQMEQAADDAGTTLTGIYQDAEDAKTNAEAAQASAESASEYAARALGNLSTVQSVTETLNWITSHGTMTLTTDTALDPTHVYFVQDNNGDYTVGGTRYAVVTEPNVADISTYYELSIDESLNNYVETHLSLTNDGLYVIKDNNGYKLRLTNYGTYLVAPDGRTVVNQNTADGNIIRATDGSVIAHLGYGEGQAESGTAVAPYYTFGSRLSGSRIGNYSFAVGDDLKATGYASYAEGVLSEAGGAISHAEGEGSLALGMASHAEGEGSMAVGHFTHAQNLGTAAGKDAQTAIGKYNLVDTEPTAAKQKAFIIGNGTAHNARSNAFTVDWSGNVDASGEVTDGSGNVLSDKADTTALDDYVLKATPYFELDTTATSGSDKDIYDALVALGWTDCIV